MKSCKGLCVIVQTDHNSCDRVLFSWSFLRAKKRGKKKKKLFAWIKNKGRKRGFLPFAKKEFNVLGPRFMVCGHRSFRNNSENIAPTHNISFPCTMRHKRFFIFIFFLFLTSTSIRRSAQIQYLSLPAAAKNDEKEGKKNNTRYRKTISGRLPCEPLFATVC